MARYRYPGTQSFQAKDAPLFYGRSSDQQQLARLIKLEQLVVLHGKSGLGKTSLLNAGVLPRLHGQALGETGQVVVQEIRFGAYPAANAPLEVLENQLWDQPLQPDIDRLAEGQDRLWCRAKSWELAQPQSDTLLLVFDQFEELFTYPSAQVQAFKVALAGLMQEGSPLWLRTALAQAAREQDAQLDRELRRRLLSPLRTKVLLTVRSDRLSLLDQFTSHLPNVLVNLYELQPLGQAAAKAAIVKPAEQTGPGFSTPPFSYSPAATTAILQSLSNAQGEVEPFQIQLLCQYLEQQVEADPSISVIQPHHFDGAAGIQHILHSYYERQIAALPEAEQQTARRFIEEGLLVNGQRAALTAGSERERFGVSPMLLQALLDSRLIRATNIHLGEIYELSHDTLVEPVTRSKTERLAREERQRLEAELATAEAERQAERRRRMRARWYAILGFSLFLLAAIASILAWQKYQQAERSEQRASATALASQSWEIYPQDHTLAFRVAEAGLRIDPDNTEVRQTLLELLNNPETSFYRRVITAHQFEVEHIAFSSDGQLMATASHDQKVILWNREGNIVHEYRGKLSGQEQPGHKASVRQVAFAQQNTRLVSVGEDGMLKVWDTATGKLVREWQAHQSIITAVAVGPSDELLTAGGDQMAYRWTLEGEKTATYNGHQGVISDVAISTDGGHVLTASQDATVRLWQPDGSLVRSIQCNSSINAAAFVPHAEQLLLARQNGLAELVDFNGQSLALFSGHRGAVIDITPFPQDRYFLTASEDGTAKVWAYNGEEILTLTGHRKRLNTVAISPDEQTIATGGFDFTAKLWDVGYNLDLQRHRHRDLIFGVDTEPGDSLLLTASKDGTAKLWTWDGRWVADIDKHQASVMSASFVPQEREIITASLDGTIRVWNYQGQELLGLEHSGAVNQALAFPNRARIVAGTADGWLKIWDREGVLIKAHDLTALGGRINAVSIHAPTQQIAAVGGNTVMIWNQQGILQDSFSNLYAPIVHRITFAEDGQSIITAAKEFPLRQWSLQGELLRTYYGHSGENYWVEFHPTQPIIASTSWDQTVRLWNTEDGNLIQTIPHPMGIYSVAFSAHSERLITGGHDNIPRIWSMDGAQLGALGERIDIAEALSSPYIAPLSEIPYSIAETNLSPDFLEVLAQDNPNQYIREAQAAFGQAQRNRYTLAEKMDYFEQAVDYFQRAGALLPAEQHETIHQQIAEVYLKKGETLLTADQPQQALPALEAGLAYAELDYLLVIKTLALAFSGQQEQAEAMCRQHRGRPTPQIEWYADFNEAVINDLEYFRNQFGLEYEQEEALKAALALD